jgi:crotonobetainyl-CoA:carnitine CoA-transferase CaiB-like acyl-CoA transferase
MKDVVENPQLHHRGQLVQIHHPVAGNVTVAGVTMQMSDTPLTIRRPPPGLGEHTGEVLNEWLGLDAKAIAALKGKGILS